MKLFPDWFNWPATQKLINAFGSEKDKLRFVGGAVRDSLLGVETHEIDAATSLTPHLVTELLEKSSIRVIPTGIKHGTVTVLIDGKNFEITTLRHDIACDGRHAEVAFTDNWREDALRRDFTMNALYLTTDGEIFDYWDGIEDAKTGLVRFIGNPHARINEDYLRILRFFRFFAYYGKTIPDKDALTACAELAVKIETLSGERIQNEMLKLLAAENPFAALELMRNSGVLKYACGFEVSALSTSPFPLAGEGWGGGHIACSTLPSTNLTALPIPQGEGELRLALLLILAEKISPCEALEILANRWRLSNDLKKILLTIVTNISNLLPQMPLARQKHLIRTLGADIIFSLARLKNILEPQEDYTAIINLAENWQIPLMPINGKDLIAVGIPEGKELGKKLRYLELLWEESDYTLGRKELLSHLSPSNDVSESGIAPTGISSSA